MSQMDQEDHTEKKPIQIRPNTASSMKQPLKNRTGSSINFYIPKRPKTSNSIYRPKVDFYHSSIINLS